MDKITFDNLPSETTAVSAENMNLMQNNIEKRVNYIGSTQPITGEKVWLKKGKNLLDKRNIIIGLYSIGAGTYSGDANSRCTKDMIEIDNTKNYILSVNSTDASAYMYAMYYNANKQYLGYASALLKDTLTLNTYSNYSQAKYINIRFDATNILEPMLEEGNSKTSYEDYVADTFIKDSNIFRNFSKPENTSYNTLEQRIGTWVDGKPLYKKTIIIQNTAFVDGANTITHNISNLKQCVKAELAKGGANIFPYFNYINGNMTMTAITFVDNTYITIRCMNDTWGNNNIWYATLYYTKTTD